MTDGDIGVVATNDDSVGPHRPLLRKADGCASDPYQHERILDKYLICFDFPAKSL